MKWTKRMMMKKKMKTFYKILSLLLLVAGSLLMVINCQHTANYNVLVIHSFGKDFPNYPEFNQLIESEFRRQGEPVNLSIHYLDCERRNHPEEISFMNDVINQITPGHKPDLIIPVGDQATYSLLIAHHPLVHKIPVMFLGVEFPNKNVIESYDNLTGVTDSLEVLENLNVVREVLGKRHVFTMMERRLLDLKMLDECNKQLDNVPYVLNNMEWKQTMFNVRNTPDSMLTLTSLSIRNGQQNSAMKDIEQSQREALGDENFFFMMRSDQPIYYLQMKSDGFSNAMLNFTNKEQFTATYHYFGTDKGIFLAGYFSPMKYQAADGVATAIRILRGEKPANIPLHNSRKGHFIDWQRYKNLGIPIDSVPKNYELVRADFGDFHPQLMRWIYSIIGLIMSGVILFLLALYIRERRNKSNLIKRSLEERKMFKNALQSSRTFVWSKKGREIRLDSEFWNYLGDEPHTIHPYDFVDFVHPDMRTTFTEMFATMDQGKEVMFEVRCDFLGNNHYEWWQICANLSHASSKSVIGLDANRDNFGIIINIEHIKKREMELIEARKMAEKAELKESFLANMSHEIRTPLNAIVGFSSILATPGMELEDEEKEDMISTINKNNDLLLKLINDVLDLSRMESGQITLSAKPCSVDKLMEYVYQSYSVQAPIHLNYTLEKGPSGLTIMGDEGRIEQVLMNFLTNAAKCTSKGYIHLGWKHHQEEGEVELYVEDSGCGLTPEQQLMIFNRFYKVDEFRQGTGLGLSICKVIAQKMKGRITVQSKINVGSRFSLWLKEAVPEIP